MWSRIFVVSGPGGAGKTTLVKQLFQKRKIQKAFLRGITVTTRKRRPKEVVGKDYFFVSRQEFLRLKQHKFFLENQKILDHYYGTPRIAYALAKTQKKDLIICIDVKGGLYLKKNYKPGRIITIFIAAPTHKELHRRMRKRAEAKQLILKRVKLAQEELRKAKYYDFRVINQNIKSTLRVMEEILFKKYKARFSQEEAWE